MKEIPVLFILGSKHCGSTLLDLLLDSHSKIVGLGEVAVATRESITPDGTPITASPFWKSVFPERPRWMEIYRRKGAVLRGDRSLFFYTDTRKPVDRKDYLAYSEALFRRAQEYSGALYVVDSTKDPDRVALLSESTVIKPIIIHIVRDGKAVTWSFIRKYRNIAPQFFRWFFSNVKIELLRREIRAQYMYVRYEALVKNPGAVLAAILEKLNLLFEEGMLDFRNLPHNELGGNRMRFEKGGIAEDEAWKREMPWWMRVVWTGLFGWLNTYYRNKKSV